MFFILVGIPKIVSGLAYTLRSIQLHEATKLFYSIQPELQVGRLETNARHV